MELDTIVFSGPNQFISAEHALDELDDKLRLFDNPACVTGQQSFEAFQRHYHGKGTFPVYRYDETASREDMKRLSDEIGESDCTIGIGGGKVIDTAKGVAENLNADYFTIPTVVGTCAAYSAVAAIYHPDHTFDSAARFERSPFVCLLDWDLLLDSPAEYFAAGIGYTVAKWYEASAISEHSNKDLPLAANVSLRIAKMTQEILLNDTKQALADFKAGKITPPLKRIFETVIGFSGAVGGFGGKYGLSAGAHAIHNGLSLLPETHRFLHGTKVSYGVLVQLQAEGKTDEIDKLLPFYEENEFPRCLKDLNVTEGIDEKIQKVAEFAASDTETFRFAVPNVTPEIVAEAMKALEERA